VRGGSVGWRQPTAAHAEMRDRPRLPRVPPGGCGRPPGASRVYHRWSRVVNGGMPTASGQSGHAEFWHLSPLPRLLPAGCAGEIGSHAHFRGGRRSGNYLMVTAAASQYTVWCGSCRMARSWWEHHIGRRLAAAMVLCADPFGPYSYLKCRRVRVSPIASTSSDCYIRWD
jgi:hypothetical protein